MAAPIRALCPLLAVLAGVAASLPATSLGAPRSKPRAVDASGHTLLQSRELWATIDVCNPADQPDTIGIRGSMPGNGEARETMYMRFSVQYMDSTTGRWTDLSGDVSANFVAVGSAKAERQAGASFELKPVPGKPAFTLRGVITFQWRRGTTVAASISRPTTAGRVSLAGADPEGFSAATCLVG
jgi:hypothetical protein